MRDMLDRLNPNDQARIALALLLAFALGMLLIGNVMHNAYAGQASDRGRSSDVIISAEVDGDVTIIQTDVNTQFGLINLGN